MEPSSFKPKWLSKYVKLIFTYRYGVVLLFIVAIILLGLYLFLMRNWSAKDTAQVCTGFFIVLTLFFAALNYEFSHNKMKLDNKAAKEVLTYNLAAEWHKSPIKDYQKTSIEFENKFIASQEKRSAEDFSKYIEDVANLDFKQSLKGILNYFEAVSIAAYRGIVDKNFIKEFHCSIFRIYYIDYYFFIDFQRVSKNNNEIWLNFTNLAEDWHTDIKRDIENKTIKSSIIT